MNKKQLCKIALGIFIVLILAITAGMTVGCSTEKPSSAEVVAYVEQELRSAQAGDIIALRDGNFIAVSAGHTDSLRVFFLHQPPETWPVHPLARKAVRVYRVGTPEWNDAAELFLKGEKFPSTKPKPEKTSGLDPKFGKVHGAYGF